MDSLKIRKNDYSLFEVQVIGKNLRSYSRIDCEQKAKETENEIFEWFKSKDIKMGNPE